jgi:hypothetical protein
MIVSRGYTGSVSQLRRVVADLRPHAGKLFCVCARSPEEAQANWAYFGEV